MVDVLVDELDLVTLGVVLCQRLGLFSEKLLTIDGSKFNAENNRDCNFTSAKVQRRMEEIESNINRYLTSLETADRQVQSTKEHVCPAGEALMWRFSSVGKALSMHRYRSSNCKS